MNSGHSPLSQIHPDARIAEGVSIGPFCVIGPKAKIGPGCVIHPYAMVDWAELGPACVIGARAIIGGDPQVYGWKPVEAWVQVGEGTLINEMAVVHRSKYEGKATIIGKNCFIMSQTHVGHDCILGSQVTLTSMAGLAGHVEVGDRAVIGGMTAVHQFVRLGAMAMIGGVSRISQDVLPCFTVAGVPAEAHGLNNYALRKYGVPNEERLNLKKAYRLLVRSGLSLSSAVERINAEIGRVGLTGTLLEFIEKSDRGITLGARRARGGQDGQPAQSGGDT